ncbi:hypothetical protein HK096_002875 [Nowakowskiella sp. JEL0078]|nr:hypothetical protein HK096_002875 [Nowakowskiella sp. JEL0078]
MKEPITNQEDIDAGPEKILESPESGWFLLENNNLSNSSILELEAEADNLEIQKSFASNTPESSGFSNADTAELLTPLEYSISTINSMNDFKQLENDESPSSNLDSNVLNTTNQVKYETQELLDYCESKGITYSCEFNNVNELWAASIEIPPKKKQFRSEGCFATFEEAEASAAKVVLASLTSSNFIPDLRTAKESNELDSVKYEKYENLQHLTPQTSKIHTSTKKRHSYRLPLPESSYDTSESPGGQLTLSRDLHWFYSSKDNKHFPSNHPFSVLQKYAQNKHTVFTCFVNRNSHGYTGSIKFLRMPNVYRSGLVNTMKDALMFAGEVALESLGIVKLLEEEKIVRKKLSNNPMSILKIQSKQLALSLRFEQTHESPCCIVEIDGKVFYSDNDIIFKSEVEAKHSAVTNALQTLRIVPISKDSESSSQTATLHPTSKFYKRSAGSAALLDKSPSGNLFADHPILLLNSWCKKNNLIYNVNYHRFKATMTMQRSHSISVDDDWFVYTAIVSVSNQEFSTAPDSYYSEHYAKTAAAHLALISLNARYVPSCQVKDALQAASAEKVWGMGVGLDEMKLFHNFCEGEKLDFAFEERGGAVPEGGICTALHVRSTYDESVTAGLFNNIKDSRIAAVVEAREIMKQVLSKSAEMIRRHEISDKMNAKLEELVLDISKCDNKSSSRWWKKCSGGSMRLHWNVILSTSSDGDSRPQNRQSNQIRVASHSVNPLSIEERPSEHRSKSKELRRSQSLRNRISPVKLHDKLPSVRARSRSRTPTLSKRSRSPVWRDYSSHNVASEGRNGGHNNGIDVTDTVRKFRRIRDKNNNNKDANVFLGNLLDRRDESGSENSTIHTQTPPIVPSLNPTSQCPPNLIYASIPQPLTTSMWFPPPPDPYQYPLHHAALAGDFDRIQALVNDKIIKTPDLHGRMPLHCLCQSINPLTRNADWVDDAVVLLSGWKHGNEEAQLRSAEIFESLDAQLLSPLAAALLVDALVARRKNAGGPPRFAKALGGELRLWVEVSVVTQVLETLGADLMSVAQGSRRNSLHGVAVTLSSFVEQVIGEEVSNGVDAVVEGLRDVEYIFAVFVVRGGLKCGDTDRTRQNFEDIISKIAEVKGTSAQAVAEAVGELIGRMENIKHSIQQLNK